MAILKTNLFKCLSTKTPLKGFLMAKVVPEFVEDVGDTVRGDEPAAYLTCDT